MSIFPTRILLATDGSGEAELAAMTARNLAESTGSELHVVHVFFWARPTALDPTVRQAVESKARTSLGKAVRSIEVSGGVVEGADVAFGDDRPQVVGASAGPSRKAPGGYSVAALRLAGAQNAQS